MLAGSATAATEAEAMGIVQKNGCPLSYIALIV
jgi:hypothetical protein